MSASDIALAQAAEYKDIPYVPNPDGQYHRFDLYVPKGTSSDTLAPLVVFVHGGAWRSEDKADYADLARRLANATPCVVAIPNYRLTLPKTQLLKHPAHTQDIHAFLHFVLDWAGPDGETRPYDPTKLYLIGHSCSSHMLSSIILAPTAAHAEFPSLVPSSRLLASVQGIIMSEGIYNIDLLLQSFPAYKEWFIADTFGDHESYAAYSVHDSGLREGGRHTRWLIIHSQKDTLVDEIQSEQMFEQLKALTAGHDNLVVFNRELEDDHNDIFANERYPSIISDFISHTEGANLG